MFDAGCRIEDADLDQEAQFLGVMAPKAALLLSEGQLKIYGERGGLLVFEPLPEEAWLDPESTAWSLLAFIQPKPFVEEPESWSLADGPLADTAISLSLEKGTARGAASCNNYSATYSLSGSSMSVVSIAHAEGACVAGSGVMGQEARYLELLGSVASYAIYGDHLWLDTDDGRALIYYATIN
jgi:heat shock protein HslJ